MVLEPLANFFLMCQNVHAAARLFVKHSERPPEEGECKFTDDAEEDYEPKHAHFFVVVEVFVEGREPGNFAHGYVLDEVGADGAEDGNELGNHHVVYLAKHFCIRTHYHQEVHDEALGQEAAVIPVLVQNPIKRVKTQVKQKCPM